MFDNASDIKSMLEKSGLRVTQQRMAVLNYLTNTMEHPTADLIYKTLVKDYPSISLATVYKTLDTLSVSGMVRKIRGEDESVHYDADMSDHSHLVDVDKHSVRDYFDPELSKMIKEYFENKKMPNFEIKDIQLNIFGKTISN